ncbi:MAG TPA: hypothetical protein VFK02_26565 [Kofleriaceae bacterium]|nr:hypothetical protein [Kofleriaceae bacterium]
MYLVAFCEAAADHRIASDLIDRVLRERGPSWVADVLDASPDGVRTWRHDGHGHTFFDLHKLDSYAKAHSVRVPHGHFDGRPPERGEATGLRAYLDDVIQQLVPLLGNR